MITEHASKITADHLKRYAYLYIRQSTLRQVLENPESTRRQYGLRRKAVALGWPEDRITTIDTDLGQSGASAVDRKGFQRLVAEVGMGRVGIVLGLEVSRLARNSSDWHRLLELCAYTCTLILDEDGLYDPTQFNDRLLLGLKGTMSEAELHVLYARLRGGLINKARRAELKKHLPTGFLYDQRDHIVLDPDQQVQEAFHLFFTTFFRLGSSRAAVRYFLNKNLQFPRRINGGPHHGELVWGSIKIKRAVSILHNPHYAGAYAFGRYRHRTGPDGKVKCELLPREKWVCLIRDAHPGYITWEQFETAEKMLEQNARAYGMDRRRSPPREGPALLQGRVICGLCGTRMSVQYHRRPSGLKPQYVCNNRGPTMSESSCPVIHGAVVDEAIEEMVIEVFKPSALEVSIAVQDEIKKRFEEVDRHHRRHVERAQYEADIAQRRYRKVDPENRLVADNLEADWNEKLRAVEEAKRLYEEQKKEDLRVLNEAARKRIMNLAKEFPALWKDPQTPAKERKRMLALLIEDVTLIKKEHILAHVRFRGGATRTLDIEIPPNAWQKKCTNPKIVQLIDQLLEEHTDGEIAKILNCRDLLTGDENAFMAKNVQWVRKKHGLKSLKQRLANRGMITGPELCRRFRICRDTAHDWHRLGILKGRIFNGKGDWMYEMPQIENLPTRCRARAEKRKTNANTVGGAV